MFAFSLQKCTPLALVLDGTLKGEHSYAQVNTPGGSCSVKCPVCSSNNNSGIYLFPLTFEDLEEAIQIRNTKSGQKRGREVTDDALGIATAFAVYAQVSSSGSSASNYQSMPDISRTGRWNDTEVAYTETLVNAFSEGMLALPNGTKLNQFLGDILLCKASRLTKKMKNAKLSTRSYERQVKQSFQDSSQRRAKLAKLEEDFLGSLNSECTRREVRFNLTKQWRSYLSNLYLQVGNQRLDTRDWVASLEELERRIAQTSDELKKFQRRCRGGSAVVGQEQLHKKLRRVSTATGEFHNSPMKQEEAPSENIGLDIFDEFSPSTDRHTEGFEEDFGDDLMDIFMEPASTRLQHTKFSDAALVEESSLSSSEQDSFTFVSQVPVKTSSKRHPKSFLEAIAFYMEEEQLPFQLADCWAPSQGNNSHPKASNSTSEATSEYQLLQAGYVTRRDIPAYLKQSLEKFGRYSSTFSFPDGYELPGRVTSTGEPQWESDMRVLDTAPASRVAGAIEHGVATAAGVPIICRGEIQLVVVLYSYEKVVKDLSLVTRMAKYLAQYAPRPKWTLCIDIKEPTGLNKTTAQDLVAHSPRASDTAVQEMITLLEENMSPQTPDFCSGSPNEILALRLFLLRTSTCRSKDEGELVETLKLSYHAYTTRNRKRPGMELCKLLVRDWTCLKSMVSQGTAASPTFGLPQVNNIQHQSPMLTRSTSMSNRLAKPRLANSSHLLMAQSQSLPIMAPMSSAPPNMLQTNRYVSFDGLMPTLALPKVLPS